jgi:hypothetical protein
LTLEFETAKAALEAPSDKGRKWPSPELSRLHRTIIELATFLSDLFGIGFARLHHCVTNASDCSLRLKLGTLDEEERLATLLVRAVEAAESLRDGNADDLYGPRLTDRRTGDAPKLKAGKITSKLSRLLVEIANRRMWKTKVVVEWAGQKQVWEEYEKSIGQDEKIVLRFEHLAWLSDLLWYTLHFWSPTYPTTSELAFTLALESSMTPPKKAELAQAAEALHDERRLVEEIRALFAYLENISHPSAFHLCLAAALYEVFAQYRRQLTPVLASISSTDPDDVVAGSAPMAFTTNFDRALERAFEDLGVTYHVIFPVRRARVPGINVEWRFRTVFKPNAPPSDFPLEGNANELKIDGHKNGLPFEGPVVVKLHGSPVHQIKTTEEHWIVLAESGYLEAMIGGQASLPDFIVDELKGSIPRRSFWFLGYSMADWNIRMRLYEHLQHSIREGEGPGEPPLKNVIDRTLDDFRFAIFPRLEIRPYIGDLNRLPGMLRGVLTELRDERGVSEPVADFLARKGV